MRVARDMIDPELRWAGFMDRMLLRPSAGSFRFLHRMSRLTAGRNIDGFDCDERRIRSIDGGPEVRVRIFAPPARAEGRKLPGVLFLHGKGYAFGAPEMSAPTYHLLMRTRDCVIVAPDDRMISESSRDDDAPIWGSRHNRLGWDLYLGDLAGRKDVPAYAAPACATDYPGLPRPPRSWGISTRFATRRSAPSNSFVRRVCPWSSGSTRGVVTASTRPDRARRSVVRRTHSWPSSLRPPSNATGSSWAYRSEMSFNAGANTTREMRSPRVSRSPEVPT